MNKIIIQLLLVLMPSTSVLAFNQKVDTVEVTYDTCIIIQYLVTIDNTENEGLWIWLDNDDYGQDYKKGIRRYMMKRRGDFSIYDIGTDPNMIGEWWHPSAPNFCFVKYLEPGKTFTIVFYHDKKSKPDGWDCKSFIYKVKIFGNQQIKEICPGLEEPYSVNRISYPHHVISFPINAVYG